MIIRAEGPGDVAAIGEVNELAFGQPDEARLVEALRADSAAWIPELSLVAEEDGHVVGHVLFTRMRVRDGERAHDALALAPVAVRPERQKAGIGSALIRDGLKRARALGHRVVIVLGHRTYYPRFGFEPAGRHGIRYPEPGHESAFMVLELVPGALAGVRGVAQYAAAFFPQGR
jgi:putative acetyltransferase